MNQAIVTAVDAKIEPAREAELLDEYRRLSQAEWPDGLLRMELLRGQEGAWRLQSTWRDLDAVRKLRLSGAKPAALELLNRLGATHSHAVFTIEQAYAHTDV